MRRLIALCALLILLLPPAPAVAQADQACFDITLTV